MFCSTSACAPTRSASDVSACAVAASRAWIASLRENSAKTSSATDTAATPTAVRCRRVAAARPAVRYSRSSAVGPGSLPAPAASQRSAAVRSAPRSRKLRSRSERSHSSAFDGHPGVLALPVEVGLERRHEPLHRALEVAVVGGRDPVADADLLRDLLVGHRPPRERHDLLVEPRRVFDLQRAERGVHGVGADHEHERVAALHGPTHGVREHLGIADPLDVDPHVLAPILQGAGEPAHERRVPPRV
jgi:hypothetical protein